jgi:hypothetical protein
MLARFGVTPLNFDEYTAAELLAYIDYVKREGRNG